MKMLHLILNTNIYEQIIDYYIMIF